MSSTKQNTGFGLGNLPYGIFSTTDDPRCRIGIAVETYVLDLSIFLQQQPIQDLDFDPLVLQDETLNRYAALGRPVHQHVRAHLQHTLPRLLKQDETGLRAAGLCSRSEVLMHLPFDIGDYTDFFTSPDHARRVSVAQSSRLIELPWRPC
jgi:fumarylacetoacetase